MAEVMEEVAPIFDNAGQAVHVAFLIMAQEATQDAPLRKALIRVMESIKLDSGNQRDWLDQLRGVRAAYGTVNFEGLGPGDIRAQCAMITQAVTTNLPEIERWVLQAKYGQTDFEDAIEGVVPCRLIDNGPAVVDGIKARRRWAFSAERIVAIKGLSDWFAPMFPKIKPLAIDCMLGMLYASHKKIEISTRDLAKSFGGDHRMYWRASSKMRSHLRTLEENAIARLEPIFVEHGVSRLK